MSSDDDEDFYDADEYVGVSQRQSLVPKPTITPSTSNTTLTQQDTNETDNQTQTQTPSTISTSSTAPVVTQLDKLQLVDPSSSPVPLNPTQLPPAPTEAAKPDAASSSSSSSSSSTPPQPQLVPTSTEIDASVAGIPKLIITSAVVPASSTNMVDPVTLAGGPAPVRPPRPSYSQANAKTNASPVLVARTSSAQLLTGGTATPASQPSSSSVTPAPSTAGTPAPSSQSRFPPSRPGVDAAFYTAPVDPSTPVEPITIKNLDTGESCSLDAAQAVFPEVRQAMTIATFEEATKSKTREVTAPPQQDKAEEVKEKKEKLGFMSRLKKAFHLNDRPVPDGLPNNTVKVKNKHKSFADFTDVKLIQTLEQNAGPIWSVAISAQGDFIATGGQDSIVRVWAVYGSTAAKELDERLRAQKAHQEAQAAMSGAGILSDLQQMSAGSNTSISSSSTHSNNSSPENGGGGSNGPPIEIPNFDQDYSKESGCRPIVYPIPYRSYSGHKADVIDLAWSKANFLLSASIDKTVRLWHVSRQKCLCVFQHADFVTAVCFHPIEDRYFVSGSFDKKLRIWNIPEHRVVEWAQTSNIITAATFSPNGNMTVAGLYNGCVVFYQTDGLKYHTQVDAKNRCFLPSTQLLTPDGGSIAAGDVRESTKLVGSDGSMIDVLSSVADVSSHMYTLEYELHSKVCGSHTVTPDHLATIRWNLNPIVETKVDPFDSNMNRLEIRAWQHDQKQSTLVRHARTFRYRSNDATQGDETGASTSLPCMSHAAAVSFGRAWLSFGASSGQLHLLWRGDVIDVRVDHLAEWMTRDSTLAGEIVLPVLPPSNNVDMTHETHTHSQAHIDDQTATIDHERTTTHDQTDTDTTKLIGEDELLIDFCARHGIDSTCMNITAPIVPSIPLGHTSLRHASSLDSSSTRSSLLNAVVDAADSVLRIGHRDDRGRSIAVDFNRIVIPGCQTPYQYESFEHTQQQQAQVDTVYMLDSHSTPGEHGEKSFSVEQVERAWDILALKPESRNLLLTELNPLTGGTDAIQSNLSRYDEVCIASMNYALSTMPSTIVAFGSAGRHRWMNDWTKLDRVKHGQFVIDQDGQPAIRLTIETASSVDKEVKVLFAPHPSRGEWSSFDVLLETLAAAHNIPVDSSELRRRLDPSTLLYSKVRSITKSIVGSYPIQKISVSASNGRLTLADRVVTHNSGRNRKGKKVTGMQFAPDGKSLLVTTNDSRIRLYSMEAFDMIAKFKGTENDELQIRAWFNEDATKVICGGENHHVYIWSSAEYLGLPDGGLPVSNQHKPDNIKCDASESFRAFGDTCTSAQFLPVNTIRLSSETEFDASKVRHLIVAAGYSGELKFFENKGNRKPC